MRVFQVDADRFGELAELPPMLPPRGFLWIALPRADLDRELGAIHATLLAWTGGALVDLHLSDLRNEQLPSRFDYTSWYDLMVFRRLAAGGVASAPATATEGERAAPAPARQALPAVATSPIGFAVFDRVLLTVHSADTAVLDTFVQRLAAIAGAVEGRGPGRLPASPADLMLRMLNHIVDGYLDLRRQLAARLGDLQQQLFDPKSRFHDWQQLLESRKVLHLLEDIAEDQRSAMRDWIASLTAWPEATDAAQRREHELLSVRSRDVLEHVERVVTDVRRLEQSAEAAVQMHFSALGHRTNSIMRTLTVLTAIFLPLNLITGFFGMNFDSLPLIHSATGLWVAGALMLLVGVGLALFFWRKRYLGGERGG